MRPTRVREVLRRDGGLGRIEHRDRGGEREGRLLHRARAGLLQMIGAQVDRVPLGHLRASEGDRVGGQPQRRLRREDIGPAREIFLDDVVLRRALQGGARHALLVGQRRIERQQPRRRRIDRHRGVHPVERQALEQHAHVADMRDRHAHLADLAASERIVAVVTGLGRQVESDGEARLPLGQVGAIERVRGRGTRMAGIGAEDPGLVAAHRQRLHAFCCTAKPREDG